MKTKELVIIIIAIVLGALTSIQAQEVVRFSNNKTVETETTNINGYIGGNQHSAILYEPVTLKLGLRVDGNAYPLPFTNVHLYILSGDGYFPYTPVQYGQTIYKTVTIQPGYYNYFMFSFNTPTWSSGYMNARFWIEEIISGNAVIGHPSSLSIIYQK